jgi:hypothetical protein
MSLAVAGRARGEGGFGAAWSSRMAWPTLRCADSGHRRRAHTPTDLRVRPSQRPCSSVADVLRDDHPRREPGRRLVIVGACLTGSGGRHDRGLDVHVISPEVAPLAKILGEELGRFIHSVHEDKGVTFHLGAERDRFRQRACFARTATECPPISWWPARESGPAPTRPAAQALRWIEGVSSTRACTQAPAASMPWAMSPATPFM